MKQKKHLFTLVEILTVAVLVAILAGVTVGVVSLVSNKAADAKTQALIKALEIALENYRSDHGGFYRFPGNMALREPVKLIVPDISKLSGGDVDKAIKGTILKYLDQSLLSSSTVVDGNTLYFKDAWDHPIYYRIPGKFNKTGFDLISVGADGKIGETDKTHDKLKDHINDAGKGDDITNFVDNQ